MEMAGPERAFHLHDARHVVSSYVSCSKSTADTLMNSNSGGHNPARDSGVDLQEPKDTHTGRQSRVADPTALEIQGPAPCDGSVSENFCVNSIINGTRNMYFRDPEGIPSNTLPQQMETQTYPDDTFPGAESRRFLFAFERSETVSTTRTETTTLEEEPFSLDSPNLGRPFYIDPSDPFPEAKNSDSDEEFYQPEEDREDDEGNSEIPSSDIHMENSVIKINKSEVQFGPVINVALSQPVTEVPPDLKIPSAPAVHTKNAVSSQMPGLQINITTPPVQSTPTRPPVYKTQSTPARSPSSPKESSRTNPRLPLLNLGSGAQSPQACPANLTPTQCPGNVHVEDGCLLVGTKIVLCPPQNQKTVDNKLEEVLKDAEDRLGRTYKRQTKRSLLPWLKGHQIMTDFYTESRIFAVDTQGKQTRQTVDLVRTLVQDDETRFILEGEPGMGKTLLACKLAIDWANKKSLKKFKFVFLIFLRDYKDNLEDHVKEELLSSLSDDKFKQVWEYCRNNEDQVLFILDGYDELEKTHEAKIQKLMESKYFQRSTVVVTSRPDVLRTPAQRIVVKGFSEAQMFEFIGKYFKLVSEDSFGRNMKRIIEKDYKYRKLAKRPLFCVLLCMLYGSDVVSKLPERLSDLMFKIMLCLIKWNNKKVGNVDENTEAFPPEYEELFHNFGRLSVQALKTDKTRFSEKEILEIKGTFDSSLLLQLGFLSTDSENGVLGPKKFWKPVHKIFMEYMAGLYIAHHINCDCRDCREFKFSSVYHHEHVLQFVVGTLNKRAHLALDIKNYPKIRCMNPTDLLMLLREAGPTKDNCRAVAKLLDHSYATVYTSEVDFEGWGSVLAQKFSKLKSLEIVWRIKSNNPDQESSFTEASPELYRMFFTALRNNTSITKIKIRATQDGEPFSEEKIELFFSNLEMVLSKENLREIEISELKMHVSSHLKKAIEGATCQMDKKALCDLEKLHLDMFMADEDLYVLCDRLKKCALNLKELQLTGLVIGPDGFSKLVELIRSSKNLQKLHICMDKAFLQANKGVFVSHYNDDYTPSVMSKDQKRMNRNAINESKRAYDMYPRKVSLEVESANSDSVPKVHDKSHRNSIIPIVTTEKVPQSLNTSEYYTDEELNLPDFDNEVNSSREQRSTSAISQQLLMPIEEARAGPSGRRTPSPRGRRSPSLPAVMESRVRSPSPMADVSCSSQDRSYFTAVKDPTKELGYLFADPFNTGTRPSYKVKHYSFIPADGENLPLPLCNDREHKSVFHELFSALPESSVKYLTLDYACLYLSILDLVCLGDAIRKTKHLKTLKLQNLKTAKQYIPLLLGLGQCQSLTTVMLESNSVTITDASFGLACLALRNNTTLRTLSLAQWEFNLQDKCLATRNFKDLLSNWKVADLNLNNCHIDIGAGMAIAPTLFTPPLLLPIQGPARNWSSIKTLRLQHVRLKEPLGVERRGHLLLPVLRNCPNLTFLDLSAASNHISPLDDKATRTFFQLLGNFKKLKELTLCNWEFKFENYEDTCSEIGQLVRSCTELRTLVLDKVSEIRSGLSIRRQCRGTFLHQIVSNLSRLSMLSLCCYRIDNNELDEDTAAHLGACFRDHWNSNSKFNLKFFGLSPSVETALHEALSKDNFSVTVNQGYPLEITVKKGLFAR